MKAVFLPLAVLAAAASAQTTGCQAQTILETCLSTTEGYLSLCETNDYACLCDKHTAIMTCYNNCPNDVRKPSAAQQQQLFCMNASVFATTSTKAASASTASTAAVATTTTTNAASASQSGTASSSSTSATATPNAADEMRVGGMLAAVAGVMAAVL